MDDRFVCERTDHSAVALIIIIRILMAVERLVRLWDRAKRRLLETPPPQQSGAAAPVLLKILGISDIKCRARSRGNVLSLSLSLSLSSHAQRGMWDLPLFLRSSFLPPRRLPPAQPFNQKPSPRISRGFHFELASSRGTSAPDTDRWTSLLTYLHSFVSCRCRGSQLTE